MDDIHVKFRLKNIQCFDEADGSGDAEPYLWTVFFKIDGSTCSLGSDLMLSGKATVVGTPGSHGNLGSAGKEVDAGATVPIPAAIGNWETTLRPIPTTLPGLTVGGVAGCIAVLMEEDSTTDAAAEKGHAALNVALKKALDDAIPTLGIQKQSLSEEDMEAMAKKIGDAVTSAVAANVSFWDVVWGFFSLGNNQDEEIGTARFVLSHEHLETNAGQELTLTRSWSNEGSWRLNGTVTASKALRDAVWRPGNNAEIQYYGQTYPQYQAHYDDLWKQGWRIYSLNTYVIGGKVLYDAVWRPGNNAEMQYYGRTYAQYQALYDDLWKKGWRIYLLNTYVSGGKVLYDAVWRPGNNAEYQYYGQTYPQYQAIYDDLWKKGWRIYLLNTYVSGGKVLYDAVWRPGNTAEYQYYWRSYPQYQALYDDLWKKGFRIYLLNTFVVG